MTTAISNEVNNNTPILTVDSTEKKTFHDVIKMTDVRVEKKNGKLLFSGGKNQNTKRAKTDLSPKQKRLMKEKEQYVNLMDDENKKFEDSDKVEWDRYLTSKKWSDEELIQKIKEVSSQVTNAKYDFIRLCMEVVQIKSFEFLSDELAKLNYSRSAVSKIRHIIGNKNIRKYISVLPTSWGTLYELRKCSEGTLKYLTGYEVSDSGALIESEPKFPVHLITPTSSKSDVLHHLNNHLDREKTDEDRVKEFREDFAHWAKVEPNFFVMKEVEEVLHRLNAKQQSRYVDWLRRTEQMMTNGEFPNDIIVNIRVKK